MWNLKNTHLVRTLPDGRELHVTLSGYRPEAWYHNHGHLPLFVGSFNDIEEAKSALLQIEHSIVRLRKTYEMEM